MNPRASVAARQSFAPIIQELAQIKLAAKREIKDSMMTGGGSVKAKLLEMNTQGGGKPPKILYCSRTHSQIQQVVQEMKKTKYKNTSCVVRHVSACNCDAAAILGVQESPFQVEWEPHSLPACTSQLSNDKYKYLRD